MTFSLTTRTSADIAAANEAEQLERARLECRRRIVAVANETTQANLTATHSAGAMTTEQATAFVAGVVWIAAMRAVWPTLGTVDDITDDTHWPNVPAGVAELADLF